MENRLLMASAFHATGHASLGQVAGDWGNDLSRKVVAQFRIGVARKKLPEIFAVAIGEIAAQKALDGLGNFGREAAIADRARDRLMETDRTT
jgi:hypothetical protein